MSTQPNAAQPTFPQLLRWLTGITRPVHRPLFVSTILRIINLTLDVVLFGLAAATVVAITVDGARPGPLFGWLVLVAVVKATAYYLEQLTGHYVAFKALELLRTAVFASMWPKAPGIVSKSRSGDILASLTRDVDRIEVVYAHTFAPVVSAIVVPTSIVLVTGATLGWKLVLIPGTALALALLVVPLAGLRSSMNHTAQTLRLRRDLAHNLTDSVFGIEEVVGYGREQQRLTAAENYGALISKSARTPKIWAGFRRASNLFLMLITMVSVVAAGLNEGLSLVVVVALGAGSLRLFEGPRGVEDAAGYLDHSFAAARRLWDISHEPERVIDGESQLAQPGDISFSNVSYSYEPESFALRDLNLQIPAGSHTVFVGPSGSGKSTAVQLLLRYDDPEEGAILIDGQPVPSFTVDTLRSKIVLVSQRNQLLNTTIRENLLLGNPDATDEQIWDVLRAVHIDREIADTPGGLMTEVGQAGTALSGGQAQRVCLARALLMNPDVLVLDEFTANLNVELEREIRVDITSYLPGATIIEVTHRLESALEADQVVLMNQGIAAAVGSPAQLATTNEFFSRALQNA